jgi:hypothetical protein
MLSGDVRIVIRDSKILRSIKVPCTRAGVSGRHRYIVGDITSGLRKIIEMNINSAAISCSCGMAMRIARMIDMHGIFSEEQLPELCGSIYNRLDVLR